MKRAIGPIELLVALALSLSGATARAQTPAPPAPPLACPPCAINEHCVDGVCLPYPDAPPPPMATPVPAPAELPPPSLEVAPPEPPPPVAVKPRPAPRKPPPREAHEEADDDDAPAWRTGVLVLPFGGLHAVEGIAANDYDVGLRLGVLLGTHVTPAISLNVEAAMDFLSPKSTATSMNAAPAPRAQTSGRDLTIAFSPLFHGSSTLGELVVGPKLGYWSSALTTTTPGVGSYDFSQSGWVFGLNVGGFAGVTDDVALGALLSYQMTFLSQDCTRGNVPIAGCSGSGYAPQILSFSVAALF